MLLVADISQCPGLVEITRATPNWKREMIEKKNRDKIEEYVVRIIYMFSSIHCHCMVDWFLYVHVVLR